MRISTRQMGGAVDRGSRVKILAAALAAAAVGMLALAGSASAKQISPYQYEKSFNGTGSTVGAMTTKVTGIAIDQSNGNLYVLDQHGSEASVTKFNAAGEAQVFSGLGGLSSISIAQELGFDNGDIVFDNSGHGGGFYVLTGGFGGPPGGRGPIRAFSLDGNIRINGFGGGGASCGVGVGPGGYVFNGSGQWAHKFDPDTGNEVGETIFFEQQPCHIEVDTNGYFYVNKRSTEQSRQGLYKFGKESEWGGEFFSEGNLILRMGYAITQYSTVDPSDNNVFAIENSAGNKVTQYGEDGAPIMSFGGAEGPYTGLTGARGVVVNKTTHDVYVTSRPSGTGRIDVFHQGAPVTVPDAKTVAAAHPDGTSAILKGIVNADSVATTECKFEWGATSQYTGGAVPCAEGNVFTGSSDNSVSYELKSLTLGNQYHFRVAAKNANGLWSYGADRIVEASTAPTTTPVIVDRVNTDGARFTLEVSPHGGTTHYHFEVGESDCSSNPNPCTAYPAIDPQLESRLTPESVTQFVSGLTPDSGYYVRVVAENGAGVGTSSYFFHTYPSPPTKDLCANAHVRQQTSASLLPDCRAYELASPRNAGGYDVESDLVPGQTPFTAYPDAASRVLFGLHFGAVPGVAGKPTNYGLDPYVAERGAGGWGTRYVGLPADGMADKSPFGSPLLGADQSLDSFALGGEGICNPCFPGLGTNIPVRLHGAPPTPGMAGSLSPGEAAPEGVVGRYMSADGSHLVFGSTKKYETAGVDGALTIYERDLGAGTTRVVSTDAGGATFSGPGTAALDVSSNGSRVVTGETTMTDAEGNDYQHLYMHIGATPASADLTPGAVNGALFNGMTTDGSRVFFTTTDKLLGTDTDASADIYEADVSLGGVVTLRLVSVTSNGAPSNSDACAPPGSPASWNSAAGDGKCSPVAYAGGAGVGADGTFYFVSPEQLDGGNGIADQANLYVVKPGADPKFVATIDSSLGKPGPPPPLHPLITANFTSTTHSAPESLAVDQSNGDLYVAETGNGKVARYTSAGAPHEFTAGPGSGTNKIPGLSLPGSSNSQVAVDNAPGSPFAGDLYVTNVPGTVDVFDQTGAHLGAIDGSEDVVGFLGEACGVAVDQSSGIVYIGDYEFNVIWQYTPKPAATAPIDDTDYTVKALQAPGFAVCNVAADSIGHVYASQYANGPARAFEASSFEAPYATGAGTQFDASSRALAVDPSTNEVFVDEGTQIKVFNSALEPISVIGAGDIGGSRGVAVNRTSHHVYASTVSVNVAEFGSEPAPFHPIDNPGIVHGVKQAATHSYGDFQVSPDGRYAAFGSSLSLTGFANLDNAEIYRYDSQQDELECASCASTGAAAQVDTFLAPYGLNLSEDGRVFFTTQEGLVLSDTNEKRDVYEWSGGTNTGRISTGRSLDDSSLLSVSQDGRDVYFFTRDVLVPTDENGGTVKVYDAREGGGYLQTTTGLPCAASDECHGPGTVAPGPPAINSDSPAPTSSPETPKKKTCKNGKVKRHGKCVRKKHKKKHQKAAHRHG